MGHSRSSNNKVNSFPDHNISPKLKNDKWVLQYGKAFFADDLRRGGSLFYNNGGRYRNSLMYALGQQDVSLYKDLLGCDDTKKGHANINWRVHPVVPKFIEVVVGNIQKKEYDIQCNAIDPTSLDAEKQTKYKLQAKVIMQKEMALINQLMGIEFGGPEQEMDPKTFEEIDLHMQMNYKHRMAIEMEEALALTLELNDWNSISEHLSRDLVYYGCAITKDYIGPDGLPKVRRVNPNQFKTLHSKTSNFKGCEAFGEVETMSIVEFEKRAGKQFDRTEKEQIYKHFSSRESSNSLNEGWSLSQNTTDHRFGTEFDDYVIKVFDFEFSSVNSQYYSTKPNRFGNTTTGKKPYGYKASKDSTEEKVQQDNYEVWYKGMWIVDSDFIFNTGLVTDMKVTKSSFSQALSSYNVEVPGMTDMNTISMTEKMIPSADDLQMYKIQLRRAVARARAKGLRVEMGALEGISKGKGNGDYTPIEVLAIYNETGNLIYRGLDDYGKRMSPPIEELENGMARDVMTFVNLINQEMNFLRDAIGVNEVADASSPDPDLLKGVAEIAVEATNNVLYPLYSAKKAIKERVCYSLTLRLQQAIKRRKISGYATALGSTGKKHIQVNKDIALHEWGMIVEEMPGKKELQDFEIKLDQSLGNKEISIDNYYYIKGIRTPKMAQTYLAFVVKKKREEDQQIIERNSKINGEEQRKSAEQTSILESQKVVHESDQKIRVMQAEHELLMQRLEVEHNNDMALEGIKHHIEGDKKDIDARIAQNVINEEQNVASVIAPPKSMTAVDDAA